MCGTSDPCGFNRNDITKLFSAKEVEGEGKCICLSMDEICQDDKKFWFKNNFFWRLWMKWILKEDD